MFRSDFDALPVAVKVKLLADLAFERDAFAMKEAPKVPRPPKWDARIRRKDGYQWASETDLSSLIFWHGRAQEGAEKGGEYAERDAKQAKTLSYWISYREAFPDDAWTGERNDAVVTARPPSRSPKIHPWGARQKPDPRPSLSDNTGGADDEPEDDFPPGLF